MLIDADTLVFFDASCLIAAAGRPEGGARRFTGAAVRRGDYAYSGDYAYNGVGFDGCPNRGAAFGLGTMATTIERRGSEGQAVTPEEGWATFDRQARKILGISGEEFLRRWAAGEYREVADAPGHRAIMRLALLAPFGLQER